MLDQQGIAADVPTGLQADARMGLSHRGDTVDVAIVKLCRRDDAPVTFLAFLGTLKVLLVAEEGGRFRCAPDLLVEDIQGRADVLADARRERAKRLPRLLVQSEKLEAGTKSASLIMCRHSRPRVLDKI